MMIVALKMKEWNTGKVLSTIRARNADKHVKRTGENIIRITKFSTDCFHRR